MDCISRITDAARLCGLRSWEDAGGGEGGAFVFVNSQISAESIMMIHGRITVMESESEVVLGFTLQIAENRARNLGSVGVL